MERVALLPVAQRSELFRETAARQGMTPAVAEGTVLKSVETDYRAMRNMIFGDVPALDDILLVLRRLENEINGRG
jgi:hypothetical protein